MKEELRADSNEKLPSKNHPKNAVSNDIEDYDESLKKSATNDESDNHPRRKRKMNETRQGSPIIKSRHDSMNNGIDGSNDNISRKKYLTAKQRKCSFSSFNECRYLEDNGRTTTTYFFSSDAETMRPNKNENHLFDKLSSSDQLHSALKEDEMKMNGHSMSIIHRNGSPVKRAIKRNSKNIGYSNSFNVSADIRRKLFVNRYKEWSLQASKKPGSNIDISSMPLQKRFSDISDETHTSFPNSNTPLIKESDAFSFELCNEGTQSMETSNAVNNSEDKANACTNGYALSLESDTSSPKHLKPESLHKPLLRPLSAEENGSKMKPSNSFLSINHAFSNPSLAPNGPPLNHQSGSILSMTSHVSIRIRYFLIHFILTFSYLNFHLITSKYFLSIDFRLQDGFPSMFLEKHLVCINSFKTKKNSELRNLHFSLLSLHLYVGLLLWESSCGPFFKQILIKWFWLHLIQV